MGMILAHSHQTGTVLCCIRAGVWRRMTSSLVCTHALCFLCESRSVVVDLYMAFSNVGSLQ